jgi:ureidoglycolate lyase
MSDTPIWIAEPLTPQAFARFGTVIAAGAARSRTPMNDGTALRFDGIATIESIDGACMRLSLAEVQPQPLPVRLRAMERHCRGTQAFMPLGPARFLVVVALPGSEDPFGMARCFVASPGEGVQYHRGTWHHPLIAIDEVSRFLVIDRADASSGDCEVRAWRDAPCVLPSEPAGDQGSAIGAGA